MRRDVYALRDFYASPLGATARALIAGKLAEAWGEARDLDVLGLGYATPFLEPFRAEARRVVAAMPAGQGAEPWPLDSRNAVALSPEGTLPFMNALFDRVLLAHALEESESALDLLREAHRVMAPMGRIVVAVAGRGGMWARAEHTPFGHGRPFTRGQLDELLREAELEPVAWTRTLYAPPSPLLARWPEPWEQMGALLLQPFAGVILIEAVKRSFAPTARAPVTARARPVPRGGRPAPVPAGVMRRDLRARPPK